MTYSIVARDPATGALGVGVQTHQPAVGAIVPWVKAGIGAIATQSFANINFGPQGLALLEGGLDAPRTLAALIAGDDLPARRQLAVLDASGQVAVHTGDQCIPYAAHVTGDGFSVQANMMLNEGVPEAMASAFSATTGHLAERIMAALEAAQGLGGDIRGSQSAAILVREPGPLSSTWDLRVDNSAQPLADLRALVNVRLAGMLIDRLGPQSGPQEAMTAYARASELYPSDEQSFWFAVQGVAAAGQLDMAAAMLNPLFERAPQWKELLFRLAMPDLEPLKSRFER
jgi:uncharacterized Ntn-hydrolase superfamily protein